MKIEFYYKKNGKILTGTDDWYFVMNNEVYCDNGHTCESQCAVVGFENFTTRREDIGWRVLI